MKEESTSQHGHPIDIKYTVPASRCASFWECVLRTSEDDPEFTRPLLVIAAHDLKGLTQRTTPALVKVDFREHLVSCYLLYHDYFRADDAWLDMGVEDNPVTDGVTLLRKSHCVEQWARSFCHPEERAKYLTVERYPFMLTRDAASISVTLGSNNRLRSDGHFAYNKAYNINKNLFDTPYKGFQAFGKDQFEGLGFDQAHIDSCTAVNNRGRTAVATRESAIKKVELVRQYEQTKQRVATALEAAVDQQTSFGVRSECRISWPLFVYSEFSDDEHVVDLPFPLAHEPEMDDAGPHRAYWVLATADVNHYISASLNRWVFLLEASATRCSHGPGRPTAPAIQQRLHGITISACRRILVLSLGGIAPSRMPELMRDRMETRQHRERRLRRLQREAVGDDDDTDLDEDPKSIASDEEEEPLPRSNLVGLGLAQAIRQFGTIWLQPDQFLWEALPVIRPVLLERSRLPLAQNTFYNSFHRIDNLPTILTDQDRRPGYFRGACRMLAIILTELDGEEVDREALVRRRNRQEAAVLDLAAEMVMQSYIECVIDCLVSRARKTEGFPNNATAARNALLLPLTRNEANGACGLTYVMVERMVGQEPYIARARTPRSHDRRANVLGRYQESGRWRDRIRGLLGYNDLEHGMRTWEHHAFRTLHRQLCCSIASKLTGRL